MYDIQFEATTSAGWAQAIELIDDSTNLAYDLTDMTFELDVRDDCGQLLEATIDNGKLELPALGVLQWRFTTEEMGGLCARRTYRVGCTATDDGGTVQLFIGSLAVISGNVS